MPLILLICEMKTFFWKQKSCLKWLSDSDANTANFHAHYQNKRNHLHISKIKDSSNAILDSQENIKNEAVHFLTHLFCDDRSSNWGSFSSILDYIPPLVSTSDNAILDKLPSL